MVGTSSLHCHAYDIWDMYFQDSQVYCNCSLGRLHNFDDKISFHVGYHAIATRHNRPDEEEDIMEPEPGQKKAFEMPELMHNLNILVDMAEEDIITNDRK